MTDEIVIREAVKRGIARYAKRNRMKAIKQKVLKKLKRKGKGPTVWKSELMQHVADRLI